MRKPHDMPWKRFAAQLTEINNFLPIFPGSDASKKRHPKELNEILPHAVPRRLAKQSYLQGWYFEMNNSRETCAMFELMETSEQVSKDKHLLKK